MTESKQKQHSLPLSSFLPNIITLIGLCLGMTAVRYALDARWELAVILLIFAGLMDWLDGMLARALNSVSKFGAQLDSLSDLVTFGVVPGMLNYLWGLKLIPLRGCGWALSLFFISCSAMRLARFNSGAGKADDSFTGLPMPIAGWLSLVPMMLTFDILAASDINPSFVGVYILFISILMVSRIQTPSIKNLKLRPDKAYIFMIIVISIIAFMTIEPWIATPTLLVSYLLYIPIAFLFKCRKK